MAKKKNRKHSRHFMSSVTACISTTMVLILVGIIVFGGSMAGKLERTLKENFTVTLLLDDEISNRQAYDLQTDLRRMPYAKHVRYISKEKATRIQAETMGSDPSEFIGYSPIPASFEVQLRAEYACNDSIEKFAPNLRKASGVTDVIYPKDLVAKVNHNFRQISIVLLVIAALLGIVSLSLINNTMRLSIARRRHSIQIMKLIGARWGFIRKPFLLNAMGMGLLAGILADGVIFSGIYALMSWDEGVASLISPAIIALTLGSVLLTGIVLTLVCAFFSVNRHLYMSREEANLY